jgi:hypothetical protein
MEKRGRDTGRGYNRMLVDIMNGQEGFCLDGNGIPAVKKTRISSGSFLFLFSCDLLSFGLNGVGNIDMLH